MLGEEERRAIQRLIGLVEPAGERLGNPVRSARMAGLSMGWYASCPARYRGPAQPLAASTSRICWP